MNRNSDYNLEHPTSSEQVQEDIKHKEQLEEYASLSKSQKRALLSKMLEEQGREYAEEGISPGEWENNVDFMRGYSMVSKKR